MCKKGSKAAKAASAKIPQLTHVNHQRVSRRFYDPANRSDFNRYAASRRIQVMKREIDCWSRRPGLGRKRKAKFLIAHSRRNGVAPSRADYIDASRATEVSRPYLIAHHPAFDRQSNREISLDVVCRKKDTNQC